MKRVFFRLRRVFSRFRKKKSFHQIFFKEFQKKTKGATESRQIVFGSHHSSAEKKMNNSAWSSDLVACSGGTRYGIKTNRVRFVMIKCEKLRIQPRMKYW